MESSSRIENFVVIVLFATLANADNWKEIEVFGWYNASLLKKYVPLENGIPSRDTVQRVMGSIKPEVMEQLQMLWNQLLEENEGEKLKKILYIDGKTMRGSGSKNQEAVFFG